MLITIDYTYNKTLCCILIYLKYNFKTVVIDHINNFKLQTRYYKQLKANFINHRPFQ